jgi:hypothetical protein
VFIGDYFNSLSDERGVEGGQAGKDGEVQDRCCKRKLSKVKSWLMDQEFLGAC